MLALVHTPFELQLIPKHNNADAESRAVQEDVASGTLFRWE